MAVDTVEKVSEADVLQAQESAKTAAIELAKEVWAGNASTEQIVQASTRIAHNYAVEVAFVRRELKAELKRLMGNPTYEDFLKSPGVGQHLRRY